MFGRNSVVGISDKNVDALDVNEMFYTLQGEGPYTGMPSIFIRLAGCNLRCVWCDTSFERTAFTASSASLMEQCFSMSTSQHCTTKPLIVLTGGEPLLQNIVPFVARALEAEYKVQIETAGTTYSALPADCDVVCSPKTAYVHPRIAKHCQHWKYIVAHDDTDPDDGLPCRATQRGITDRRLYRPTHGTIWVQPRFDYLDTSAAPDALTPDMQANQRNTAHAVAIALRYRYRLSLQTHKYLGLP